FQSGPTATTATPAQPPQTPQEGCGRVARQPWQLGPKLGDAPRGMPLEQQADRLPLQRGQLFARPARLAATLKPAVLLAVAVPPASSPTPPAFSTGEPPPPAHQRVRPAPAAARSRAPVRRCDPAAPA